MKLNIQKIKIEIK